MKNKLGKKIIKEIKDKEIQIKSPANIFVEKIGLGGATTITLLSLGFILGFIFYWVNFNEPILGSDLINNFAILFSLAPIVWIIFFLVLFLMLLIFLRQYDFSYKKPFLYILFIVSIIMIICGYGFNMHQPTKQIYKKQCNCAERSRKMQELKNQGVQFKQIQQNCPMMSD